MTIKNAMSPRDAEAFLLLEKAIKSGRYLFAISILDEKKRRIDHHLFTNNYPKDDMPTSIDHFRNLVSKEVGHDVPAYHS